MHRVIFYIPNTSIKLIIRAKEFVFRKVCRVRVGVRVRKRTIIEVKDEVRKFSMVKVIPVL